MVSYFTYGFPEVSNNRENQVPGFRKHRIKAGSIIDETTSAETVVPKRSARQLSESGLSIYSNWIFGDTENVGSGSDYL